LQTTKTILLLLLVLPLFSLAAARPSRLKFDSTVYDFGTTNTPPSLTGTFSFQNSSSVTTMLRRPSTSCGCAVASVTPERLHPGERATLVFTINLAGYQRGLMEKTIYIQADHPGETGVTLIAKANLIPLYDMEPSQLSLGDLPLGATTNATARLWRTDGKPLDIARLLPSQPNIAARLEPLPNSNTTALVHVKVKSEGGARWFYERVGFHRNAETQEVAAVGIYARFVGDVVLSREEIYWAIVNRAIPGNRTFRVKASDPARTLEIKNLACTVPEVVLKSEPASGGGYEIILTLRRLPAETTRGTVSFDTNMASQPKVTVPITINMLRF